MRWPIGASARAAVRALSTAAGRDIEVVEALSLRGRSSPTWLPTRRSIASCSDWTLGGTTSRSHADATELLRASGARNATGPGLPHGGPDLAGTVTVEVATLVDEFIWLLEDTAAFVAGRVAAAIERYIDEAAASLHGGAGPV